MSPQVSSNGLDGVVVADTVLSQVDGEAGRLVIHGRDLEDLAGRVSFEGVCGLLWESDPELAPRVRSDLGAGRVAAHALLPALEPCLQSSDGMDALRATVSQLPSGPASGGARSVSPGDRVREYARIAGAVAVFAAAWARRRTSGEAPVAPDPALPHARDFLRMIAGALPARERSDALDAYLATVAEHGMNASTFAARVVASTGSDGVSAVVAALGALKGPLHGGAPGPVLDMLDAIGDPARARAWLEAELAAGRRIMGLGHRVYRVRDPRAAVLEGAIESLERAGIAGGRLALARAVEGAAARILRERHPRRSLAANVEFYTALLLDAIGLDREVFTPTFAVARTAGWLAHIGEQRRNGRLIRPRSRYIGPEPRAQRNAPAGPAQPRRAGS